MTPSELQTYLHQHIPLSQAMQVTVVEASLQQVVLTAPLAPNIIESASLNLKYPFGLSLSKPCAALRQAQRERFK